MFTDLHAYQEAVVAVPNVWHNIHLDKVNLVMSFCSFVKKPWDSELNDQNPTNFWYELLIRIKIFIVLQMKEGIV